MVLEGVSWHIKIVYCACKIYINVLICHFYIYVILKTFVRDSKINIYMCKLNNAMNATEICPSMLLRKCLLTMLMLILVILMLILMLLNLNTWLCWYWYWFICQNYVRVLKTLSMYCFRFRNINCVGYKINSPLIRTV